MKTTTPVREVHLECLIDTCVLDEAGHWVGRIEEVRVQWQGEQWVVTEFLMGTEAWIERLSAWEVGTALLRHLGGRKFPEASASRGTNWISPTPADHVYFVQLLPSKM